MNYGPAMDTRSATREFVQRVVIAGAALLGIIGGLGGAGLVGQAHADDPPCLAGAADPCLVGAPRSDPPPQRRTQTVCRPAGMAGQHCFQQRVP